MRTKDTRLATTLLGIGLIIASFKVAAASAAEMQSQKSISEGQKAKIKGVIIARDGDTLRVRDKDNAVTAVLLSDGTKVELLRGALGLRTKEQPATLLLPGLRIEAEGQGNAQGQLAAGKIYFTADDLEVAKAVGGGTEQMRKQQQAIQAQTQQTEGEVKRTAQEEQMLSKRVSELDDYDVRETVTVYFDTGSTTLSAKAKSDLDELAKKTLGTPGYMVEVTGFADKSGSEAKNQLLSKQRAQAVVRYLEVNGNVPQRRMLVPAGYGEARGVGDQATTAGRAENRRVEVKILVNRALAAK